MPVDRTSSTDDPAAPRAGRGLVSSRPQGPAGAAGGADDALAFEAHVLQEEARLGSTEQAQAVNDALRALARAARSFLLYDPHNDAIRAFLEGYEADMRAALDLVAKGGASGIELEVRPFELVWEDGVVYREDDRERSLAYRMFRDGVRRLTIGHGVQWEELIALLRILSIRFTGVRMQEEDIVTLLWKAGFKNIELVAVEGFVPDEPQVAVEQQTFSGNVAGTGEDTGPQDPLGPPLGFDLPAPPIGPAGRVLPALVPKEDLEAIRHEATSRSLPALCVRLLTAMLAQVADPEDPTDWPDVEHLVEEVRDFLLAEGQLGYLTDVVRALEDLRGHDPRQVDHFISGFVDARALRRIVHTLPKGEAQLPVELARLLDSLPGQHLQDAIDVIVAERSDAARHVGRQIIARFAQTDPDLLLDRITRADTEVAADLLAALSQALPDRRVDAARLALDRGDAALYRPALDVLSRADDGPDLRALLLQALHSDDSAVRLLALEQITGRHADDLFDDVRDRLVALTHGDLRSAEADAFGKALMSLDGDRALVLLSDWIRPPGFIKRLFQGAGGTRWLRWAAVSGLGISTDREAEQRILWLEERCGQDLARHCRRVRARRHQERSSG